MSDWSYDPLAWATGEGSDYDEWTGDDGPRFQVSTVDPTHILYDPILALLERVEGYRWSSGTPLFLVTHEKWSGYSEFTITSTWDEVHVHKDGTDLHWQDMGAFLRDLSDLPYGQV